MRQGEREGQGSPYYEGGREEGKEGGREERGGEGGRGEGEGGVELMSISLRT